MKIKIRYTLVKETLINSEEWNCQPETTPEQLLQQVKTYCDEDPSYAIDDLSDNGKLTIELVK